MNIGKAVGTLARSAHSVISGVIDHAAVKGPPVRPRLILVLLSHAPPGGLHPARHHRADARGRVRPWSNELPPHRLAAGDEFDLRFLLNPELNDAKLVIGPDGRVTVPLLGAVAAAGLTVPEFRRQLEGGYASKLRVADLDVVVRNYASSRIFVGGEVKTPGVLALQGPTDALQGVLMAGGFLTTARSDEVVLIRRRADRTPMLRTLNLRRYAGSVTAADDLPLQPPT